LNPFNLHLRPDPVRGKGVFGSFDLPAGLLLEESPVLVVTKEEWEDGRMNDTILGEYGFCWANGGMAIGLGIGEC
jgi:tRNA-specific adenosine deaminase 3